MDGNGFLVNLCYGGMAAIVLALIVVLVEYWPSRKD
jgi:hypothetical protein